MTNNYSETRDKISKILVEWDMPIRQIVINKIVSLLDKEISEARKDERRKVVEEVLSEVRKFKAVQIEGDYGDDEEKTHAFINRNSLINILVRISSEEKSKEE